MSEIVLDSITKEFDNVKAANAISTVFEESSLTCVLGPSGCGKTTMLRIIAGLETPDSGRVLFGGEDVTNLSVRRRDIGMVFQYPVVYRGLTIYENLELPLLQDRSNSLSSVDRNVWINQLLSILNLSAKANTIVDGLDNESRQKVAVGRAVVRKPKVVIFDEPVTNVAVDAKIEIQRGIKQLSKEIRQTILYVTHDQTEAMTLADKIVLLQSGSIVESASPIEVYDSPKSAFGGYFLGSPGMNFIEADIEQANYDGGSCLLLRSSVLSEPLLIDAEDSHSSIATNGVMIGIRPEEIRIVDQENPGSIRGQVRSLNLSGGGRTFMDCVTESNDNFKVLSQANYDPGTEENRYFLFEKENIRLYCSNGNRIKIKLL